MTDLLPFEGAFWTWIEARGMGWNRIELQDASGGRAAGYRLTPSGSSRRAVIAFHGAGSDALFGWVGLFKRLLEVDTEIFTFDLPGHGRFSTTAFAAEDVASAVGAALRECSRGRPAVPLHAIGVSLGGSVLLHVLPRIQGLLASATLIVAPLRVSLSVRTFAREVGGQTLALLWREREHYGLTGLIPSFGPFRRQVYPLRWAIPPPPGAFGYVTALNQALDEMRLEKAAKSVQLPVLLIYGDRDLVVPIEQGERLIRALPRGELLRVRGGTHLSTPLEPVTFDRILRWIGERS